MNAFQEHEFDIIQNLPGLVITNRLTVSGWVTKCTDCFVSQFGEWVVSHVRWMAV